MGETNNGGQIVYIRFGFPAKGDYLGKRFVEILPVGIYGEGGELTKVNNNQVKVSSGVFEIWDNTMNVQVCIRTSEDALIASVSLTKCWLILRYEYRESRYWYGDFIAVTEAEIGEGDVVLGKALYSGSTLTGFDYDKRSVGSLDSLYAGLLMGLTRIWSEMESMKNRIRTLEKFARTMDEAFPFDEV